MGFIAGQYTCTYNAQSIGQTATGLTIEHVDALRHVLGDKIAETVQDSIFRGMNMFGQYTLIEYNAAGAASVMWPYGTAYLTQGVVGRLAFNSGGTALAQSLILTAVAGTPAATAPATLTFPRSILADGFPVGLLF